MVPCLEMRLVGKLDSGQQGTNLKAWHPCAIIPLRPSFSQEINCFDDGQFSQYLYVTHARHRRLN
jgi:hypothetical protein